MFFSASSMILMQELMFKTVGKLTCLASRCMFHLMSNKFKCVLYDMLGCSCSHQLMLEFISYLFTFEIPRIPYLLRLVSPRGCHRLMNY